MITEMSAARAALAAVAAASLGVATCGRTLTDGTGTGGTTSATGETAAAFASAAIGATAAAPSDEGGVGAEAACCAAAAADAAEAASSTFRGCGPGTRSLAAIVTVTFDEPTAPADGNVAEFGTTGAPIGVIGLVAKETGLVTGDDDSDLAGSGVKKRCADRIVGGLAELPDLPSAAERLQQISATRDAKARDFTIFTTLGLLLFTGKMSRNLESLHRFVM